MRRIHLWIPILFSMSLCSIAATFSVSPVFAQSSPGFTSQQVLTAAGLNGAFVTKQDYVGVGTAGDILTWSGSAPAWGPPSAAGVSTFSGGTTGLTPSIASTGAVSLGGMLAVANGGTGTTSATGSGSVVLSSGPTLVAPALGTPASGVATNLTGLPLTTGITGTLAVAHGGTGSTTSTGSGAAVLATSPTLVTPNIGAATGSTVGLSGIATALHFSATQSAASASPTLDASSQTVLSVAASANAVVMSGNGYSLLIIADVVSTGQAAVWLLYNGNAVLVSPSAVWVASTTTPGASQMSIHNDGTDYRVYVGSGISPGFRTMQLKNG